MGSRWGSRCTFGGVAAGIDAAYVLTEADGNQTVYAIDLESGKQRWSRGFASSYGDTIALAWV